MCLGLSGRIVSVEDGGLRGEVEIVGTLRRIDLSLLSAPVVPGEHVLIHSGFALQRISAEYADELERQFGGAVSVDDPPRPD